MTALRQARRIRNEVWHVALLSGLWMLGGCASTHMTLADKGEPWDLKNTHWTDIEVKSSLNRQSQAGVQCLKYQHYQEATRCFGAAILEDPADHKSHFGLGVSHELMGQRDEAITEYEKAVSLAPTESKYRYHMIRLRGMDANTAPASEAMAGATE